MFGLIVLSLTLTLSTLASCSTPAPALPEPAIPEEDQAAIYAAVVRQLYTVDHTFGDEPPNWPIVYLLRATNDRAGDPRETDTNSRLLAESLQEAIVAALDDLPAEFIWIDDRSEVIDETIIAVKGNGALITLGNTYLQGSGKVHVAASIYFSSLGAGGTTYIVEQVDGIWKITGKTGAQWIS